MKTVRIACISDTHNHHKKIKDLPKADIIVCTGDISSRGYDHELQAFCKWFGSLNYKHKVLTCGNHDIGAENQARLFRQMCEQNGIVYLNDTGKVLEGLLFWGSPVTPRFGHGWAFNRDVEDNRTESEKANYAPYKPIQQHWNIIPAGVDVLLTHGPPEGILDVTYYDKKSVGCPKLFNKVQELEPKLHVFGHIHEQYGRVKLGKTEYINASICTLQYDPDNPVQVAEVVVNED